MTEHRDFPAFEHQLNAAASAVNKASTGALFVGTGWQHHLPEGCLWMAAIGQYEGMQGEAGDWLEWMSRRNSMTVAHLCYHAAHPHSPLPNVRRPADGYSTAAAFVPQWSLYGFADKLRISWPAGGGSALLAEALYTDLVLWKPSNKKLKTSEPIFNRTSAEHQAAVNRLKQSIQLGDLYQANLCLGVHWSVNEMAADELFLAGYQSMPNPYSVYYKHDDRHCLSFSPELYLSGSGAEVQTQPMKGTAPRHPVPATDIRLRDELAASEKDRRENVMVVDMVRHDLSRVCRPGSVRVPKLFQVSTYAKVHQMHSTVVGTLRRDIGNAQALLSAFPMGSMCGAPKASAMAHIDTLEPEARGLFSGTIGFFTPQGMMFNVVIRSLFYDAHAGMLEAKAGGGITALSDAEAEYDEAMLKLQPLLRLLDGH